MAKLTSGTLQELVKRTIDRHEEIIDIISRGTQWEKWFQCSLFGEMILNGLDAQVDACPDYDDRRYGFIVLNDDGSA